MRRSMTFVLSQIYEGGVIMGSDSSETSFDVDGKPAFSEVDKTLYYPEINIGISTWGDAVVEGEGINEWLNRMIADFTKDHDGDHVLEKITYFLADKLDEAFGLNKKDKNESVHMGLHISGYNWTSQDALPGILTPRRRCFLFPKVRHFFYVTECTKSLPSCGPPCPA